MAAEMHAPNWLTESPERHLRPKLDAWLDRHADWELLATAPAPDGCWEIRARWRGEGRTRELRAAAIGLIGSFSEASTMITQTKLNGAMAFDVVTGQPADRGGFAAHGHLVRLIVERG